MNAHRNSHLSRLAIDTATAVAAVILTVAPAVLRAQSDKDKNPASKLYVSDLNGEAQIDTGDNIQDLNKRSVYNAQGTIIETKRSDGKDEAGKTFTTSVFSNGTGAFFDQDTRVEIRKFVQEPFTPTRSDMDVEPSISQTQAYVARGAIGLCASKLVAGSTMNYATPNGSVSIRGKKIVIEASENETKISMLEGDSTVRAGDADLGGKILSEGQQAVIRRGRTGQPDQVTIRPIPQTELPALDDKVAMACMAKKTVYFEVRERTVDTAEGIAATGTQAASTASGGDTGSASSSSGSNVVTAFFGPTANNGPQTGPTVIREIVPVEVVPVNLPVQFTVSPARIVTPPRPGGGG